MVTDPGGNRLEKKARLTPLMIAKLFGVHVGEGSKRREPSEDGTSGVGHPVREPLAVLEARTRSKGSKRMPSVTIGLVVIRDDDGGRRRLPDLSHKPVPRARTHNWGPRVLRSRCLGYIQRCDQRLFIKRWNTAIDLKSARQPFS